MAVTLLARNLTYYTRAHCVIKLRTIMTTTPLTCEQALKKLENNSHYAKYAQKIAKLQQTSPEEFMSRAQHLEPKPKRKTSQQGPTDDTKVESKFSQLLRPKQPIESSLNNREAKEESLNDVMKLDLVRDKSVDEITQIWLEYHKNKDYVTAVISVGQFETLEDNFVKHPTFLFALPRKQGYEFIMSQMNHKGRNFSVHFTPLLYYQVHKENAPECLAIHHYTELGDDKKIVLMRGEYDKNVIDFKEAQCLVNQMQLYYGASDTDPKRRILEQFTKSPDQFKHMDLIKQIENLTL